MATNQSDALDQIQEIMSAERWSPDTLEAIAEVMKAAGYNIDDVPDEPTLPGAQPEEPQLKAFHVRYNKSEMTVSRYGMLIFAPDAEAAKARLKAGFEGDLDLTEAEYATEQHEKEFDSDGTDFVGLAEDPWNEPTEVDPEDWDVEIPKSLP